MCYEKGESGVPQNYLQARRYYALAAAQGDADAAEDLRRLDASQTLTRPTGRKKPKPNAPCACGSGQKYKKCCGANR